MWVDGKNIKTLSLSGPGNTNNRTETVGGGFGLSPTMEAINWPDSTGGVTEETHPGNIRKAIGTIRDNSWDIWNFLRDIASAINSITGGETTAPTAIPPEKNFANP
jgi:hypothetical protein